MPYIDPIASADADGTLAREYEAAMRRAGRTWNIVSIQCRTPETLEASMRMFVTLMHRPGTLRRPSREMLAVVRSQANVSVGMPAMRASDESRLNPRLCDLLTQVLTEASLSFEAGSRPLAGGVPLGTDLLTEQRISLPIPPGIPPRLQ